MRRAAAFLLLLGAGCAASAAPDVRSQTHALHPQAVTAVDVSADGRRIAVTTLAFRQDRNVWVLSSDGEPVFSRHLAPWAPFQVAALDGGQAYGVGLAYSRVTSPYPMLALFGGEKDEETVLEDSYGDRGWLRYGEGDWKTGWLKSLLGDQLVRAGPAIVTMRGHNGAMRMTADGQRAKFSLKYDRPYRMAASTDGRAVAMGYIVPELAGVDAETKKTLRTPPPLLSVIDSTSGNELWKFAGAGDAPSIPDLPEPAKDLPELPERFNLRPDAIVPFRVAVSVAADADGTTIAAAEYGGRLWVRRGAAIGKWDPPYHVIPFVPRQRGTLRIVKAPGQETVKVPFPKDGLFDVRWDRERRRVWAIPLSWFARGMAGSAWLPTDEDSRSIYEFDLARNAWRTAWTVPDAVSDVAVHPSADRVWISCWDGRLHLAQIDGGLLASVEVGGPARVEWSADGRFAIAGTAGGEVLCLEGEGMVKWRKTLPTAPPPAETVKPVYEGIPIYSVGRVGKEHAYVGDIWLIRNGTGGFLVDAAGSSSLPHTLQRIRAAGADPAQVKHLLHTHSHGDHCGGAYLWRAMGLQIVAPESASFAMAWLMPMLTDYGVWVPRPVDVPLPLKRAGDETTITIVGVQIRAVFVPGHSMDSVIYMMELNGKRVVFTGDIGFQAPSDILHRCWTDAEKAAVVVDVVRRKVIPFKPDVVFTGHGGRSEGTAFLEDLAARSEESIRKAGSK